jgi:hypothetical protein
MQRQIDGSGSSVSFFFFLDERRKKEIGRVVKNGSF